MLLLEESRNLPSKPVFKGGVTTGKNKLKVAQTSSRLKIDDAF